ncbi:Major facilitator superfamily domain general substrate transporter [Penicillium malachiteum]|uniref:Major facilitator superfamily domain general substrate transporter n=1 Tax=Penicillium malachiteum TaxID=1324776 RepID=UPI00254750FD|nr:Major facilitator superfamily domain general substrate transporter [Penicillium malachiteum]KAJ5721401.1 Major facilitator superfamily domain general substrate transporter [Penicillium malachiteum]
MGEEEPNTSSANSTLEELSFEKQSSLEKQPSNLDEPTKQPTNQPLYPETDLSQGIIGWEGQDDPENPQNFPDSKKWILLGLISAFTLVSPLASSMFSPAVVYMGEQFGETNEIILALSVSIYLIGYTFGPLFLAPLSEIYGRRVVLSVANWFFVVWQIGCALSKNIETLIVCRLFAGIGGSACITLGAGVVADLFHERLVEKRLRFGEVSWQWIFWLLLIVGGAMQLGIEVFNKETYAPVIIKWKVAKMAKELGRTDLESVYDVGKEKLSPGQVLKRSLLRPALLLVKSPIVAFLCIYMSFVYGLLYLFFTTISDVFTSTYGFSVGLSGLAYLGIGLGFACGLFIMAITNDKIVSKMTANNGGKFEPEMRMPTMIIFACIIPISFFWYGWTADKHVFWIVPIIGMFPFGVGMMGVFIPIQTYVIDCYPAYAASANAALTATRSLVGALLPLAGTPMFDSLGLGWGNSLLGFIALVFVPVPIIFVKYGKTIREKWPINL